MDMELKEQDAKIIRQHVLWSMGAGLVPLPVIDIVAVTLVQMDMLKQLCNLHDKDFSASEGKTILTALTGAAIARMGASLVKAIPGVGTLLGGASMSIMSGASTYAVARVAILHFESGGNLFDLDMDKAKEIYKDTLDKGKKYASDLDKERKKKKGESDDIFEKLEKLAVMKEKGIVSEKEFDDQKEKLLERL